ncbi:hypothetical protein ACIGXI_09115 [Kitasatospora aureofaciens]
MSPQQLRAEMVTRLWPSGPAMPVYRPMTVEQYLDHMPDPGSTARP